MQARIEEAVEGLRVAQAGKRAERQARIDGGEEVTEEPAEEAALPEEAQVQAATEALEKVLEAEKQLDADEAEILENLGKFIKYNKFLQQLDLSHTGMRTNLLRELASCLRRAKSLLTLDLSGNPGVNNELRKYISDRIRCKPDPLDLERLNYVQGFVHDVNKAHHDKDGKNQKILQSMQVRNIREVTGTKHTDKLTGVRTFQENENLIY